MTSLIPPDAPALYSTEGQDDPLVCAVYYHEQMGWSWFLLEYDRDEDMAFGLVDGFFEEMGYFSLADLESVGCKAVTFEPGPLSSVRMRRAA